MICKICNKNFIVKRNISTLFSNIKYDVCNECYKKYPIKISYNVLPVNNYNVHIYSLFDKKYYLTNDPFNNEFSRLFSYAIDNNMDKPILVYNNIYINETKIDLFDKICNLNKSDIILICNYYDVL